MIRYICIILLFITNISYAESFENEESPVSLEPTITDLTDKIEKLEHQNNLLHKKLEALAADVEFRFKEIETKSSQIAHTKTTTSKVDPKLAKAQFDKAYMLLKEQQYEEAEHAFTQFIQTYPNSAYTGNAYYWLGESFMFRKRYDKASVNYLQSFSKFPKSDKADLSMLKLSSSLNQLGKKKESCAILAKLKIKKDTLSPALQKLLQKELKQASCK